MKTDIQIAQEAEMLHIREVAAKVGASHRSDLALELKAVLPVAVMHRLYRWKI